MSWRSLHPPQWVALNRAVPTTLPLPLPWLRDRDGQGGRGGHGPGPDLSGPGRGGGDRYREPDIHETDTSEPETRRTETSPAGEGEPAAAGEADSLRSTARFRFAGRGGEALREVSLGLAIFGLYLGVAHGLSVSRAEADARGADLLSAERWLHLAATEPLNRALTGHSKLEMLAAWEYATTYIITTFGLLGILWARADPAYRWARNSLAVTTLIGVGCFALWPTTPPRLLPGEQFVDTVAVHHPPMSWGGGPVSAGANQFAAMPSLHTAWAVWVVVATMRSRRRTAGGLAFGVAHLGVTVLVVLATANHYVLDVAAGVAVVLVSMPIASMLETRAVRRRTEPRVAAADELFLHVETPTNPQYVGGVAILDTSRSDPPDLAELRRHVEARLPEMARLTRRLRPAGRWRHHRWTPARTVDLSWHVQETVLAAPGGRAALNEFVAQASTTLLDTGRPPWRLWLVHGVEADRSAVVVVVHHAVADGLGVVALLRHLLDPPPAAGPAGPPAPRAARARADGQAGTRPQQRTGLGQAGPGGSGPGRPGLPRRLGQRVALGVGRPFVMFAGLIGLGRDGHAPQLALCGPLSPNRRYLTATLPLDSLRAAADRLGVRITDLLLAVVGEAVGAALTAGGRSRSGQVLRAAVPVTMRAPGQDAEGRPVGPGNLTAAVRLDVPLETMPVAHRARLVAAWAGRRRGAGRLLASAAVLRVLGALPAGAHRRTVRAAYQARFFTAIVSNMRGVAEPLRLLDLPLLDVYPILPLAEGVPVSVGALGWNGQYCMAATVDPGRIDPEAFAAGLQAGFAGLLAPAGAGRNGSGPDSIGADGIGADDISGITSPAAGLTVLGALPAAGTAPAAGSTSADDAVAAVDSAAAGGSGPAGPLPADPLPADAVPAESVTGDPVPVDRARAS